MKTLCIALAFLMMAFSPKLYANTVTLNYTVHASGFHVMDIIIAYKQDKKTYSITMDTELHGLLGKVVPWRGIFETSGIIKDDKFYQPLKQKAIDVWEEDTEERDYTYNKNGPLEKITIVKDGAMETPEPEKALTEGTIDALSLLMRIINQGQCDQASDMFDGKRRFTVEFTGVQDTVVKPSKYNIYEGPAQICEAWITPKGGQWHKKPRGWMMIQEQAKAKKSIPHLYMAYDYEGLPVVPVKGLVKTDYGAFLLHLQDVEISK